MNDRHILSIDLKSFFASVECILRGLDPFSYPLVVANAKQGMGAITLAVTPYLKKMGVKSRGRLYEIPDNIKYYIAKPRMNEYISFSKRVIGIYLKYVAQEDLYVYSIDECFLDVTDYLKLYKMNDYELAKQILTTIKNKIGLTATCGIGPNILLAKVAMDIEAKHSKDMIAKWDFKDIQRKLWNISPLSNMWGIGIRMELKLNKLGIYSVGDLAKYDRNKLIYLFGVVGNQLWEHANGVDNSIIKEMNKYKPSEKSFSNSQILFKDYNEENIEIIIREMVDVISKRLYKSKQQAYRIGLNIGYSKNVGGGFYHVFKLDNPTDDEKIIFSICLLLFKKYYKKKPIRKVGISLGKLVDKKNIQLNIFENIIEKENNDKRNFVIDNIVEKFGKNSLLRASSLLEDSTIRDRNKKIGGHSA